jgi:hypothetical protein
MTDQHDFPELSPVDEVLDVVGHDGVAVLGAVGGVAMVPEILVCLLHE